jgi:hypothetical protein
MLTSAAHTLLLDNVAISINNELDCKPWTVCPTTTVTASPLRSSTASTGCTARISLPSLALPTSSATLEEQLQHQSQPQVSQVGIYLPAVTALPYTDSLMSLLKFLHSLHCLVHPLLPVVHSGQHRPALHLTVPIAYMFTGQVRSPPGPDLELCLPHNTAVTPPPPPGL